MKQYKKLWAVITLLCFALTLMPVAAFAADGTTPSKAAIAEVSSVYTTNKNVSEKAGEKPNVGIHFSFDDVVKVTTVYVWFVKDGSDVPAASVKAGKVKDDKGKDIEVFTEIDEIAGVFTGEVTQGKKYEFAFPNSGNYTVHAALKNPGTAPGATIAEQMRNVDYKLANIAEKTKFEITSNTESSLYTLQLVDKPEGMPFSTNAGGWPLFDVGSQILNVSSDKEVPEGSVKGTVYIGAGPNLLDQGGANNHLATNGVPSDDITFKLLDKDGKPVKGATVNLSTSNGNCIVNKNKVTTDQMGQFKFNIAITEESPNIDGFTVYIESGSYEARLNITASSTGAHSMLITKQPQTPISTDDAMAGNTLDDIWIAVKDVNGNFVKPFSLQPGADGKEENNGKYAEPAFAGVRDNVTFTKPPTEAFEEVSYANSKWGKSAEDFVSVVSKPAASKLENKDIWMCPVGLDAPYQNTLYTKEDLVPGDYIIKISLANGKSMNVSFKVAEMGTPVKIAITPKATVMEQGSKSSAAIDLVDANGVKCDALKKGTDVAVSGYGVDETELDVPNSKVVIYTKNDDKYAGSEIKIIATNDRYNLVGESIMNITDDKAMLVCPTNTGVVNQPLDLTYLLMDNGKMMNMTIGDLKASKTAADAVRGDFVVAGGQTGFVVVAKPDGAKVNLDARAAGGAITSIAGDAYAVGRIECDKPGVVTVRMSIGIEIKQSDEPDATWSPRYYEGTQNILFTEAGMGKTVVMSIGSNEIVVNDKKAAIDAAPVVKNNRTYVPFRALAEAFGAEVAYDEATQAVTAELNGTKVVMTIGSATYTVNGTEKTADVAPFINGSRTMVPVRFVAEAFGCKVIPTYDDNGATADVLFTL